MHDGSMAATARIFFRRLDRRVGAVCTLVKPGARKPSVRQLFRRSLFMLHNANSCRRKSHQAFFLSSSLTAVPRFLLLPSTLHARRAIPGFRFRLRINPMAPYNALNYGLGLSSCTFRAYLQVMQGALAHAYLDFWT